MYICDFSRSVGAGSATTRKTRGLTRSVIALIVPPLPAPSRPSKMMHTLQARVHHPLLELDELDMQAGEFALVLLPLQLAVAFHPVTHASILRCQHSYFQ